MTDNDKTAAADKAERIAKVMARAGVASRRDAERMILEGRVAVNGRAVDSPALDVLPSDRVTLDGKPIDAPQAARLWLYYKPLGLVTSAKDEKGRQTVFDTLPAEMPRVMSIGRLDLNSEGLLLLTNDGELKRRLELPATGWLRKYRVRVNGRPSEATFDPLRRGITVEGETFLPMEVTLDKQQGANAWLTIGLREGKNREVRRALAEVKMIVNRLIRVSYGPFRLNKMKPGDVVEVKQKTLREQLGEVGAADEAVSAAAPAARSPRPRRDGAAAAPRDRKPRTGKPASHSAQDRQPPRAPQAEGGARPARKPYPPREDGPDRARPASSGDSAARRERTPYADKPRRSDDGESGARPERKPYAGKAAPQGSAERPRRGPEAEGGVRPERKPYAGKAAPHGSGDRPRRGPEAEGGVRPERKPYAGKAAPHGSGDRPRRGPEAEGGARPARKPYAGKPASSEGASRAPRGRDSDDAPRPARKEFKPRSSSDPAAKAPRKATGARGAAENDRRPPKAQAGAEGARSRGPVGLRSDAKRASGGKDFADKGGFRGKPASKPTDPAGRPPRGPGGPARRGPGKK